MTPRGRNSCTRGFVPLSFAQDFPGGQGAHFSRFKFFQMPGELANDLILKQIDYRVKVFGFLRGGGGEPAGLHCNFAALPVLVNRQNDVSFTRALEELSKPREFALGVTPDGFAGGHLMKGDRDGGRNRPPGGPPLFTDILSATLDGGFGVFHLGFALQPEMPIRLACDLRTAGSQAPAGIWRPYAARY